MTTSFLHGVETVEVASASQPVALNPSGVIGLVGVADGGLISGGAAGAAPNNATVFSLVGGSAAGAQGGSWSSTAFKGRLQAFAASPAAQVAISTR